MFSDAASRAGRQDGRRGLSGPARVLALALTAAGLALGLAALLAPGRDDADRAPPRPIPAVPVSVSIDMRHPGGTVPGRFLGLSFEVAALHRIAGYSDRGNLVGLLRSLGTGMLRFGGVTADTQVAWTGPSNPRPAWAKRVIDASDMKALGRLAARSGWRVLLTVGLAHYDAAAAAHEVARAKAALGHRLAAVEIGNEPDAYATHGFRSLPWTYAQYDAEVRRYRHAIARVAHHVPVAGPGVSGSRAYVRWGLGEATSQRPALLTGHHYPLGCRQLPPPSIERLLSPEVRRAEAVSLARYTAVARLHSIPFRLDETNSVSCGGTAGISDTFAAALWATGYIAQTMAAGIAGINFEGEPANCAGYTPVCAQTPGGLAAGALGPQPEWYSLLLAKALLGTRPLRTRVTPQAVPNLSARAFRARDGGLRVVIVDYDPPGSPAAAMRVRVGGRFRSATQLVLTAPSPAATAGVRLGGRPVARDGSWHAPTGLARIPQHHGVLSLTVQPSSATLLTVLPPSPARRR